MTIDQAIGLCVQLWIVAPGMLLLVLPLCYGHLRMRSLLRWARVGLFFCGTICISDAQGQAQAQQQDATRRIERLEDYRSENTAKTSTLETIVSQQKEMLAQLIATNARQDERIATNSDTLQEIAVAAKTIKESQDQFANRVTWVGGLMVTAVIVAGFLLDRVREKRMRNGHNPITQPIKELEEKLAKSREETNALLKELIEIQSQPRRRAR